MTTGRRSSAASNLGKELSAPIQTKVCAGREIACRGLAIKASWDNQAATIMPGNGLSLDAQRLKVKAAPECFRTRSSPGPCASCIDRAWAGPRCGRLCPSGCRRSGAPGAGALACGGVRLADDPLAHHRAGAPVLGAGAAEAHGDRLVGGGKRIGIDVFESDQRLRFGIVRAAASVR